MIYLNSGHSGGEIAGQMADDPEEMAEFLSELSVRATDEFVGDVAGYHIPDRTAVACFLEALAKEIRGG